MSNGHTEFWWILIIWSHWTSCDARVALLDELCLLNHFSGGVKSSWLSISPIWNMFGGWPLTYTLTGFFTSYNQKCYIITYHPHRTTILWNHHHHTTDSCRVAPIMACYRPMPKRGRGQRGLRAFAPLLLLALLARGESFVPPQECGGVGCATSKGVSMAMRVSLWIHPIEMDDERGTPF